MIQSYLFGFLNKHIVERPTVQQIKDLMKEHTVFAFKVGKPELTSKIKSIDEEYLNMNNGIWCLSYFTGITYWTIGK